ncbi:MAG: transcription antitermination factor NusB [Clostridia bacterium]|nr:transcription antitermination factor NusB [Clostridia bacterium]
MLKRRDARELAFQIIFEKSFTDSPLEEIFELAREVRDVEPDKYVISVTRGVYDNLEALDAVIEKYAVGRSKARLSKVVLALLRLALYEIMLVPDIEESISVNEAVELAKKYSVTEEAKYINGVLGSVVRAGEKLPELQTESDADIDAPAGEEL